MAAESGPSRPIIRANVGVQDALLHNPKHSPFAYQAPMTCCNHIVERTVFRPLNVQNRFGSTLIWEFSKVADLLGPCFLIVVLAALTQPASPPVGNYTKIRYIDNLGIGMIESIRVTYGPNLITDLPPEWLYIRYRKYRGLTSSQAWRALSRMDQTLAERDSFANLGGEVVVDLTVPWADDTSQYFSMVGMSDKLRFQIRLKTLDHILNYDKTDSNPASPQLVSPQSTDLIQDIYIRAQCVQLTGAERDSVVENVKSADGQAKMVEDIQTHIRTLIPTSATPLTFRLPLTNITGPVRSLFWYLEDPKNTSGTNVDTENGGDWPHNPLRGLGSQVTRWCIVSGGNTIWPWTSSFISRFQDAANYYSGVHVGEYIFACTFSPAPETPNASMGTLNFGQCEQPTLIIEFAGGLLNTLYDPTPGASQGAYLNVIADTVNFHHEQGGDFIRVFN